MELTNEEIARFGLRPSLNHLSSAELETLRTWNSEERVLPELSPEEEKKAVELAIKRAREEKGLSIFKAAYNKKVNHAPEFPNFNAKEFKEMIIRLGMARSVDEEWKRPFTVDEHNSGIISTLSMYFTSDPRFLDIDESFSFSKGILLIGPIGCGKTQLMQLFCENPKMSYSLHDCQEIVEHYSKKDVGSNAFDIYEKNIVNNSASERYFGCPFLGRFFDDLAAESLGKHMGSERNVMAEIIQRRYKRGLHSSTLFTSNLVMEQLEVFYGARVADRLPEMCNIIQYPSTATSRRK